MAPARLLVIDDEPNVLYSLQTSLQSDALEVITASNARQGIDLVRSRAPDAVISDVRLPDMSGLDAFDHIHELDPRLPVIIVTAYSSTETAIDAMRRGAFEYLLKPLDLHHLRDVVRRALEVSRLSHVPAVFDDEESGGSADRIVGSSPVMQEIYKAIGRVAAQDVTVLIQGESGTGKELVARAIYHYSRRSQMPFMAINCAAIPEALLESELFGHERGAFTGADRRRIGKFEQATGGTIFLDEVADMTPATQAKVLRLLQEQRFERVGSNETIQTDVRVIVATNKNLEGLVTEGRFRQDLFYRLNGYTIRLPPLRERGDDLRQLVDHFIKTFNRELNKQVRGATSEVLQRLVAYPWPGNVRELQGVIRYAMVHAAGDVLTVDCLPRAFPGTASLPSTETKGLPVPAPDAVDVSRLVRHALQEHQYDIYRLVHAEVDRRLLAEVLRHVKGNQLEAAELLGISRTTLRAKLRALGLAIEKHLAAEIDPLDRAL